MYLRERSEAAGWQRLCQGRGKHPGRSTGAVAACSAGALQGKMCLFPQPPLHHKHQNRLGCSCLQLPFHFRVLTGMILWEGIKPGLKAQIDGAPTPCMVTHLGGVTASPGWQFEKQMKVYGTRCKAGKWKILQKIGKNRMRAAAVEEHFKNNINKQDPEKKK